MTASAELGDVNARRAIDAPADAPLIAISGPAASGKTETLARRYVALLARDPALGVGATIVSAADAAGAAALAARIDARLPAARLAERHRAGRFVGVTLDRLAFDMLAEHATLTGLAYDLTTIDDYDAHAIFERAIAPLLSADWSEFLGPDIDPEIPGLRAPDRFGVAVLRLIHKLRDAQMGPDAFLKAALRGATAFYGSPPNLSSPALLFATKDEHRGALTVGAPERERQRRREIDLAKIIAKLYRSYLDELVARGCLAPADTLAEATRLLSEHPAIARAYRRRFSIALVDDVHDLHTGEFRLLQAIFGPTLVGVTVAGDADAATRTFAGARPDRVFKAAATTIVLQANYRVPTQIAAVVRALLEPRTAPAVPAGDALRLHRADSPAAEAAFVADSIAARIAAGTPPGRIAILHRSLRNLGLYEDALLERNIPIDLDGDAALFARHDTLDALAILWSVVDPFRHAWLIRVLQLPLLDLGDATLALLCGEPASPQAALFEFPAADETDGSRRWDRRRDLRLGTNVVRGDRDTELEPAVRERLNAFRARRLRWQRIAATAGIGEAARAIVSDAGLLAARPGETGARTRRRALLVDAFIATLDRYAHRHAGDDLRAALSYCERIANGERGPLLRAGSTDAVVVAAIDRIKGRRFEDVFIVDVRAGSFPPYYVPDAFLFSATYGMIPKDSVGEAVTSRTVKFTWYTHFAKLRENFAREDRRALSVALARADRSATVSMSGRPTRGVAAPELFVELQALQPRAAVAQWAVPARAEPLERAADVEQDPVSSAVQPPEPARRIAWERLVEMLACVRCAPRGMLRRAQDASFTLLSGRLASLSADVEARDIRFAYPLGPAVIFGTVPAFVRHAGQTYVMVWGHDAAAAALAVLGLPDRVCNAGFFVENDDGEVSGPHPLDLDMWNGRARAIVEGTQHPLCSEHDSATGIHGDR